MENYDIDEFRGYIHLGLGHFNGLYSNYVEMANLPNLLIHEIKQE